MRKEMDSKGTWIFENNNWVVQSNKLIEAQMSSSLLEKKIFVAVVMQIQPTDEKFKEYSVGVKRMLEELRISKTDFYREIDKATDNLLSRNVVIEKVDVKKSKKLKRALGVPSYLCGFTTLRKINYIKACFFQRFNTERTSFLYL